MVTINYNGSINTDFANRTMEKLMPLPKDEHIFFNLTSVGGQTSAGIGLYYFLRKYTNLTIIGLGELSSTAVIVFLAANQRFVTQEFKMIIHSSTLTFEKDEKVGIVKLHEYTEQLKCEAEQYSNIFKERVDSDKCKIDIVSIMAGKQNGIVLDAKGAHENGIATGIG